MRTGTNVEILKNKIAEGGGELGDTLFSRQFGHLRQVSQKKESCANLSLNNSIMFRKLVLI